MEHRNKSFFILVLFLTTFIGTAFSSTSGVTRGFEIVTVNSTYTQDGGVQVLAKIIVNYPVDIVYKVINDFKNYGDFMPSFGKTKVTRENNNTKVKVNHNMPILGSFPCFMVIQENKKGDAVHIEFKTTICFFDKNEGYYSLSPINNGKETELIFSSYLKKDSIFVPKFIIKFVLKYAQKDVLGAIVKRIREIEKNTAKKG
mgnify:CR=1 FL=1